MTSEEELKRLRLKNKQLLIPEEIYDIQETILRGGTTLDEVRKNAETSNNFNELLFSLSCFNEAREAYVNEMVNRRDGVKREKSTIKCRKCNQYTVEKTRQQTKSGDEGETVIYRCLCGNRWTV